MSQPLNVGFVGLGIMGAPMCGHLIAAGHNVFVTTRSKVPDAIAQTKAVVCGSPKEDSVKRMSAQRCARLIAAATWARLPEVYRAYRCYLQAANMIEVERAKNGAGTPPEVCPCPWP